MIRDGVQASMAPNATACSVVMDHSLLLKRAKLLTLQICSPSGTKYLFILAMFSAGCAAALLRIFFWTYCGLAHRLQHTRLLISECSINSCAAAAGAQHGTRQFEFSTSNISCGPRPIFATEGREFQKLKDLIRAAEASKRSRSVRRSTIALAGRASSSQLVLTAD